MVFPQLVSLACNGLTISNLGPALDLAAPARLVTFSYCHFLLRRTKMKKQRSPRPAIILLGGSVSDWLVLVVGVLLAGIVTAAFVA